MADVVSVTVTAKDGATKVFQAVSSSAQKMGSDVEGAGKKGAAGVEQMGKAAESSAGRMKSLAAEGAAIGAVFGVVAAGAAKAGAAYQNQQRQIQVIGKLYGDQADEILKFSDAMQQSTRFSDDAARQSAQIFATLRNNYDVSQADIQRLMSISADLASAYGLTLEDASQRIQAAIRGEGEAAEALGLTMNQQAIDRDNLTLSMSNQEAAQFRLNALYQQTANLEGYANERANTAGGQVQQFLNTLQDGTQVLGEFLGPIGDVAAQFAPIAIAAPIATSAIGGLIGKFKETATGAAVARAGMTGLSAVTSPLGLAMTGLLAIGGLLAANWLDQKASAEEYKGALSDLDTTIETVRRKGDDVLAGKASNLRTEIASARTELESYKDFADYLDIAYKNTGDKMVYVEGSDANQKAIDDWYKFQDAVKSGSADATGALENLNEAMNSTDIDASAYIDWALGLISAAEGPEELAAALHTIDSTPLNRFRVDAEAASAAADKLTVSATKLRDVFKGLPATMDDLRIDGKGEIAGQLDTIHTGVVDAFTLTSAEAAAVDRRVLDALPSEEAKQAYLTDLMSKTELSATSAEKLDTAWGRIQQKMTTGDFNNVQIMTDVMAVLNDTSMNPDEKVAEIEKISLSMSDYIDKYAELKDAQTEWLADGDNFLAWWQSYQQTMADSAGGVGAAGEAWLQFQKDVAIASGVQEASEALDQVLRTFGEIDSLGQRSASSGSIADTLIGKPGEAGALQDLWTRIADGTSDAALAQDDYNRAIESGIAIQESNVRVQDDLNVVRAKQLPLLAQEQAAYEQNIERIAGLNAVEARRVLLLQDTAVQTQIAGLYSQAYAAAIGEVPKEVATKMILEAAEADAGLKDLLLNLGLIQQNADGTISVNFPDAESVGASIDRVTLALLHMQAAAEGKTVYEVAVEIYGEEEAKRLLGMVEDADGTTSTMNFTVVSQGLDAAGNTVETIKLADGTQVTVVVGVAGLDQLGKADSDIKAVTLADGTVVTVKTDVDTTGWDKKTFEDLINGGEAVQVKTVLKPPDGFTVDAWNNSDGPGESGGLPDIKLQSELEPPAGPPDLSGVPPVGVQAELVFEGAENRPSSSTAAGTGASLSSAPTEVTINTVLTGTANQDLQGLKKTADDLDGTDVTVTGNAEVASAVIGLYNVTTQADTLDGKTSTVTVEATDNATGKIAAADRALGGIDGNSATLMVTADTSDAENGIGWAQQYDGVTLATSYVDIVTRQSTVSIGTANYGGGSGLGEMFGGVAGYAQGGTVRIRAAEAGPEWIDYPSGGGMWAMTDGIYTVPKGAYVNTAPASRGMAAPGGNTFTLIFNGDVIGAREHMAQAGIAFAQAWMAEQQRYMHEQGVD